MMGVAREGVELEEVGGFTGQVRASTSSPLDPVIFKIPFQKSANFV